MHIIRLHKSLGLSFIPHALLSNPHDFRYPVVFCPVAMGRLLLTSGQVSVLLSVTIGMSDGHVTTPQLTDGLV